MIAKLDNASSLLLDRFQRGFPLVSRPFEQVGRDAGIDEAGAIHRYQFMIDHGLITRIGVVVAPNVFRVSTLAAMAVLPEDIERIAVIVNGEPNISHNYERDHVVNLWFVVSAEDESGLTDALERIEARSGSSVRDLRLVEPYHLDLGFPLCGKPMKREPLARPDASAVLPGDKELLAAIEDGIPLVERPFHEIGPTIGRSEHQVLARLSALQTANVIRRFGVIVRHRMLGLRENAMVVWDVSDKEVRSVGKRLAREDGVTLCYRRRRATDWPFNLYCMVHGAERATTLSVIDRLNQIVSGKARAHSVLFSKRCFRQTGPRFGNSRSAGQ